MADCRIAPLSAVPGALSVLAGWYIEAWAPYYGPGGPGDAEADLRAALVSVGLPVCMVAFEGDEPRGTASLKAESVESHRHLSPWLAAMVVPPEHRRRGVGAALVAAVEAEARDQGFESLYTATDTAAGLLVPRGWRQIDEAQTLRGSVQVWMLDLAGRGR